MMNRTLLDGFDTSTSPGLHIAPLTREHVKNLASDGSSDPGTLTILAESRISDSSPQL